MKLLCLPNGLQSVVLSAVLGATMVGCVPAAEDENYSDALAMWEAQNRGKADQDSADSWATLPSGIDDWLSAQFARLSLLPDEMKLYSSADAALEDIKAAVGDGYQSRLYRANVRVVDMPPIDHTEVVITAEGAPFRLIGDGIGAGVLRSWPGGEVIESYCLTWPEVEQAVRASYVSGYYTVDFVCHTVTEYVLRAIDVDSYRIRSKTRSFGVSRALWGPLWPKFGEKEAPLHRAVRGECR